MHRSRARRHDDRLHLHRVDDRQRRARGHGVPHGCAELDQTARHRTFHRALVRAEVERGEQRRRGCGGRRATASSDGRGLPFQEGHGVGAIVVGAGFRRGRERRVFRKQRRAGVAGTHPRVAENGAQHREVGGQTGDVELVECAQRPFDRGGERRGRIGRADDLGQQRIEVRGRRVSEVAARIDPHARPRRFLVRGERPRAGRHDPRLYGEAARRGDRGLIAQAQGGQRRPRGEPELRLDQIDAGDLFRDRVFDLNARVALDEEILAGLGRDEEFHRSRAHVVRGPDQLDRSVEHGLPERRVERGGGRRLHDLLMAELHRTVAFVQVDDVPAGVRQHLDLDVPRPGEEFLDEQGAVSERGLGFAAAPRERLGHLHGAFHRAHPASSPAGRGFEHRRIALRARQFLCLAGGPHGATRQDGNGERRGEPAGANFVPEQRQCRGRRADEDDAGRGAPLGKRGVLGQKPVARMNTVAAAGAGDLHERVGVEIGADRVTRCARPELVCVRGTARMQRPRVHGRIHGHGLHTEGRGGPGDADRDFAAVADQDPCEHPASFRRSGASPDVNSPRGNIEKSPFVPATPRSPLRKPPSSGGRETSVRVSNAWCHPLSPGFLFPQE